MVVSFLTPWQGWFAKMMIAHTHTYIHTYIHTNIYPYYSTSAPRPPVSYQICKHETGKIYYSCRNSCNSSLIFNKLFISFLCQVIFIQKYIAWNLRSISLFSRLINIVCLFLNSQCDNQAMFTNYGRWVLRFADGPITCFCDSWWYLWLVNHLSHMRSIWSVWAQPKLNDPICGAPEITRPYIQ